jgi:hypothetical protein
VTNIIDDEHAREGKMVSPHPYTRNLDPYASLADQRPGADLMLTAHPRSGSSVSQRYSGVSRKIGSITRRAARIRALSRRVPCVTQQRNDARFPRYVCRGRLIARPESRPPPDQSNTTESNMRLYQ